ncbi:Yip1 family protein [Marininema halotolerans]|nr:Yip1 family protein [Marininema halotolerans]
MNTQQEEMVTSTKKPSLLGIITEPTTQFQRIAEGPVFWSAFLIILLLSSVVMGITSYVAVPHMGVVILAVVGVLIGIPAGLLLTALFQWLFLLLLGGEAGYKKVFALNVYLSVIVLLGSIVQGVGMLLTGDVDAKDLENLTSVTSLAAIIPTDTHMMKAVLSSIEVFSIWHLILTAMGLTVVGKVSSAKGWTIAIVLFVIGVAFAAGAGALGDMVKDFAPPQ